MFKNFKVEVENQLVKRIKNARSNSGEYYSRYDNSDEQCPKHFAKFLEEYGIILQYIMPSSPIMNNNAKR